MDHFEEIVQSVEFIEAHLQDEVTVVDVAQTVGISTWHFQRVFRQYVGETLGSYLRRRRLACALDELRSTERKVIDVALDYQFGSSEAFSRAFKAEFGLSPQQFRQSGRRIVPFKKPVLDRSLIHYIVNEMELAPAIREIEPILVVGLPVSFVSPLSQRSEYMSSIPGIWTDFVRREGQIPHKVGAIKVGVIEGMATPRHHIHDEIMDYLACTPVTQLGELGEGLRAFTIPGGKYAVFKATGYHEQTQFMIDHVYASWLPQAEYERTEGPEFTWLDHRTSPLDPLTSVVGYFLPIR